jgi:hypothetical protein
MRVAVIGGTGKMGGALALRTAAAGHEVVIGTRERARGDRAAGRIREQAGDAARVSVALNPEAPAGAEVVVLAVPYAAHGDVLHSLLEALHGTVLLDVCEAVYTEPRRRLSGEDLSAAQEAARIVEGACPVVGGLTNLWAPLLADLDREIEDTAFLCGDDAEAKAVVIEFARSIGLHPLDAGPLARMRTIEQLGPLTLCLAEVHEVPYAGIRALGIEH